MNTKSNDTRLLFGSRSVPTMVNELRAGTPWAKGMWAIAVLVGLIDLVRWHSGGAFGYDTQHVWQAAHAILHGRSSWNQFVYPPGCLLFAFPFAALPFKVSELLVYALLFAGIAYTLWAMTRVIKIPLGSVRVAWLAVLLTMTGQLGIAFHYENFTLLLIPLAAAFFLAVDQDSPMTAAVVLGISLTLKPLLAPLVIVLLLARQFRETVVAVLIPVVLSAITMVIVLAANANPSGFVHEVGHTFSSNTARPWNMSISAMGNYIHAPNAISILLRAIVVIVCLSASWMLWKHPRGSTGEQAIWFSAPLFVILILCFSFAWGYYALLLLPLGFASLQSDRVADWVIRLGVFLALAPPILVYTVPGYPNSYYHETGNGIFGVGILLNGVTVIGVLVALTGTVLHAMEGVELSSLASVRSGPVRTGAAKSS